MFLTNLQLYASQDMKRWSVKCGLLWCLYQLFELILTAPIHCRGSIGEQVMWSLTWPEGDYIFSKFSFLGELYLWCHHTMGILNNCIVEYLTVIGAEQVFKTGLNVPDIDLVESLFVTLWTLQMGRVTGEVRRRWSVIELHKNTHTIMTKNNRLYVAWLSLCTSKINILLPFQGLALNLSGD